MTIGKKIRQARKNRGMTQAQLSEAVGIPCERTRQYETDLRTPKEPLLQKYADVLDFPVSFFSDHQIETKEDVLQLLFELEDNWDFKVEKSKNGYVLTTTNESFLSLFKQWYLLRKQLGNEQITHREYEHLRAHLPNDSSN